MRVFFLFFQRLVAEIVVLWWSLECLELVFLGGMT